MTTKEKKIALVNKVMNHIFDLSLTGVLSYDEVMYLYNELRHLRQYLTELHLLELQGVMKNEKYDANTKTISEVAKEVSRQSC